jgi:MerR family copper efflux transcriptional regulator
MGDLTGEVLREWLEYRGRRWPHTANPHLLVSTECLTCLRGLPATLEQLRIDCQLAGAMATGSDPLHLAEVFGISEHTAIRYAVNARQLTAPAHQGATPASPAAPRPTREDRRAPGLAISGTELPQSALDLRAGLKAYRPGVTTYRVSELAERTGLPPSTVRFYEQAGLVPARRSESGYRLFDDQAVDRIEVITTGKRLGLPLEEIRDLLQAWEDGLCQDVRDRLRPMLANQIASAERRAAETGAFIERLRKASSLIDGPAPPGRCGPGCGIVPRDAPSEAAPAVPVLTPRRRDAQPEPPIACTLTAADQADRIGEWRRLLGQADGREQTDGGLAFRFPGALAGQVAELAAAEQQCCPFLEFSLRMHRGTSPAGRAGSRRRPEFTRDSGAVMRQSRYRTLGLAL